MGSIKIGDTVVWTWAQEKMADPTRFLVIDESVSRKDWDYKIYSRNSGRVYTAREDELSVVQVVERS